MKKLIAAAPREAALVEYEDRGIKPNEVKISVEFASPKHGTEVVDFRGITPFMDEDFNEEWRMFMPREEGSKPGIVFGEFQLGNMIVGKIVEVGSEVTDYQLGESVCTYGPIMETLIVNAVDNHRLRKMPERG